MLLTIFFLNKPNMFNFPKNILVEFQSIFNLINFLWNIMLVKRGVYIYIYIPLSTVSAHVLFSSQCALILKHCARENKIYEPQFLKWERKLQLWIHVNMTWATCLRCSYCYSTVKYLLLYTCTRLSCPPSNSKMSMLHRFHLH